MKKLLSLTLLISAVHASEQSHNADPNMQTVIYYTASIEKQRAAHHLKLAQSDTEGFQHGQDIRQKEQAIDDYVAELGSAEAARYPDNIFDSFKFKKEIIIHKAEHGLFLTTLRIWGTHKKMLTKKKTVIRFNAPHMKRLLEALPYIESVTTQSELDELEQQQELMQAQHKRDQKDEKNKKLAAKLYADTPSAPPADQ